MAVRLMSDALYLGSVRPVRSGRSGCQLPAGAAVRSPSDLGSIEGEPPLNGAQRDTDIVRNSGQRHAVMQMRASCRHSPRHLRVSFFQSSIIRHGDLPCP